MKKGREIMYNIFEEKDKIITLLQNKNCPSVFGLSNIENCESDGDCVECWKNALNQEYEVE